MSHGRSTHRKFTKAETDDYGNRRRQMYGAGAPGCPTPESRLDYERYSKWTTYANASVGHYEAVLKTVAGVEDAEGKDAKGKDAKGKDAKGKEIDIEEFLQHQHRQMVPPAAQAASDTNIHASYRNAFLDDHPYAFRIARSRRYHERLADKSNAEAEKYRQIHHRHLSGTQNDSPNGTYGSPSAPSGSYRHGSVDGHGPEDSHAASRGH